MNPYNLLVSDSTVTSEFIDVLDNKTRKIVVSDATVTSEYVDVIRAGSRNISVSDSTVTSEFADELRAGSRNILVTDSTITTETFASATINNPALIIRSLLFTVVVPAPISLTIQKT